MTVRRSLVVGVMLVVGAGLFVAVRTLLPGLSISLDYADTEFQLQPLNVKAAPPWRLARALPSEIRQLHQDYEAQGLRIVAINIQESQATADAWRRKASVPFAIVLDPEGAAASSYGVRSTPTVFLVDRDGNFLGAAVGTKPWSSAPGRAVIEKALRS